LLLLPVAAWIVTARRRVAVRFITAASLPLAAFALVELPHLGSTGSVGRTSVPLWGPFVQTPWLEGLAGVLASPSRGLFVYSPVLLFSLWGMAAAWRGGSAPLRALVVGVVLVVLTVAKWFIWWGGHSYGPRLLADLTPVLCFFLFPVAAVLGRSPLLACLFWGLVGVSACTHALGAFFYDARWDAVAGVERRPAGLWSWSRGPLAFHGAEALDLLRGLAGGEEMPSSIDAPALLGASYTVGPLPAVIGSGEPLEVAMRGDEYRRCRLARNRAVGLWGGSPRLGVAQRGDDVRGGQVAPAGRHSAG
jgi:hypothetical protein